MSRQREYSEESVLRSAQQGMEWALERLYDDYAPYIMGLCMRYVADRSTAEDRLQEIFIRAFGALSRFENRGEGAFRAWLSRIAVHECISYLRTQRVVVPLEDTLADQLASDESMDESDAPSQLPPEVLAGMIADLPVGYRTVFNLYVIEEHSHREIAEMLGIAPDSSASQLSRAKKILAKRINEYLRRQKG